MFKKGWQSKYLCRKIGTFS